MCVIKTHTRSRISSINQLKQITMKKYNPENQNVIDYLESLNDENINSLLENLFSSDDLDERMDICTEILTTFEFMVDDEDLDSEWFSVLEDELKEITLS